MAGKANSPIEGLTEGILLITFYTQMSISCRMGSHRRRLWGWALARAPNYWETPMPSSVIATPCPHYFGFPPPIFITGLHQCNLGYYTPKWRLYTHTYQTLHLCSRICKYM